MLHIPPTERIIVALDFESFGSNEMRLIDRTADHVGGYKIGLTAMHSRVSEEVNLKVADEMEYYVRKNHPNKKRMMDGKWKDIPNQMAGAARGVAKSGAWGFTVHTSNQTAALKATLENAGSALVIGVTVLTSMNEEDCEESYRDTPTAAVQRFARKFWKAGGKAMVCSPSELEHLYEIPLMKITPGIRDADAAADDQSRVATAYEAIRRGAEYLVIGRPITDAPNSSEAAQRFAEQVASGLAARLT